MTTAVTRQGKDSPSAPALYVAFELAQEKWLLGFTPGVGQRPRRRTVAARAWQVVLEEIALAKRRFGLAADARVVIC